MARGQGGQFGQDNPKQGGGKQSQRMPNQQPQEGGQSREPQNEERERQRRDQNEEEEEEN